MEGRERLAAVFTAAVRTKGWSQEDVARHGGPATTTQTRISTTTAALSAQTCRKIDTALGWPPGSALRIQAGDLPTDEPPAPAASGPVLQWRAGQSVDAGTVDVVVTVSRSDGHDGRLTLPGELAARLHQLVHDLIESVLPLPRP